MFKMYFDGASRGNPGPASYGGVIYKPDGEVLLTYKDSIGTYTNNVAEYLGLIVGQDLKVVLIFYVLHMFHHRYYSKTR